MIRSEPAKILIADDEDDTRQFLYDFLQQLGHQVIAVANGKETIKAALSELPDVILLDIMMPEMSGLEVCQTLKETSQTKDIPIVFVTAKATINDQITGLMLGAHDYINKPYRITELTARLNSALRVKRLQDELKRCKKEKEVLLEQYQETYQILILSKQLTESFEGLSVSENNLENNQEKVSLLAKQINQLIAQLKPI